MADSNFERVWNEWHLELCTTAELAGHVFDLVGESDCDDWVKSAAAICRDRLRSQAENAPIPPFGALRGQ